MLKIQLRTYLIASVLICLSAMAKADQRELILSESMLNQACTKLKKGVSSSEPFDGFFNFDCDKATNEKLLSYLQSMVLIGAIDVDTDVYHSLIYSALEYEENSSILLKAYYLASFPPEGYGVNEISMLRERLLAGASTKGSEYASAAIAYDFVTRKDPYGEMFSSLAYDYSRATGLAVKILHEYHMFGCSGVAIPDLGFSKEKYKKLFYENAYLAFSLDYLERKGCENVKIFSRKTDLNFKIVSKYFRSILEKKVEGQYRKPDGEKSEDVVDYINNSSENYESPIKWCLSNQLEKDVCLSYSFVDDFYCSSFISGVEDMLLPEKIEYSFCRSSVRSLGAEDVQALGSLFFSRLD